MIRVGFIWEALASWTGGVNYLHSLLAAIMADPGRTVEPVVFAGPSDAGSVAARHPELEVVTTRLLARGTPAWWARKLVARATRDEPMLDRLLVLHRVDLVSHAGSVGGRGRTPSLAWIVDLQHRRLPEYFSRAEILRRDATFERWRRECAGLLFSSQCALKDFRTCFPGASPPVFVVPFVPDTRVPMPADVAALRSGHRLVGPYFMCPNQFWPHKNHEVVLKAVGLLRSRGIEVNVVFTGAAGPGDSARVDLLRSQAAEFGNSIRFLGLLPYEDVIGLMQGAIAVINPSRFEGWSTTVEEARNLGRSVILSDIDTHREQSPPKARFFAVDDASMLAEHMSTLLKEPAPEEAAPGPHELQARRHAFAVRYQQAVVRCLEQAAASGA